MKRQRALADASLAGPDRHEMTHAGEPVGNPGALVGDLLEDSRSAVADDVVVGFHSEAVLLLTPVARKAQLSDENDPRRARAGHAPADHARGRAHERRRTNIGR